jgi:hypothetical protein
MDGIAHDWDDAAEVTFDTSIVQVTYGDERVTFPLANVQSFVTPADAASQ